MNQVRALDAVVPMRDGVGLATDVVVLDDDATHPVLLVRTPYSRAALRTYYDPVALARAGWAVVLQDVRGRVDSGGTFRPFLQEVDDGVDAVSWCAEQPWSDGRVAMAGASYNAASQWLAAAGRPPALRAIAPVVIGTDLRDDFCFEGGVFQQGFLSGWAVAIGATGPDPEVAAAAVAAVDGWPEQLRESAGVEAMRRLLPEYGTWHGDDSDWWEAADIRRRMPDLDLPAWHLAGWYDVFCEGSLSAYAAMVATSPAGPRQRLVVGPWAHVSLHQQVVGEVDFGLAAGGLARGLPGEMLGFLRAALDGGDLDTGVTVFVMGANTWRDLEAWPPAATPYTLWLSAATGANSTAGDGVLSDRPDSGTDRWQHDAADPVPTWGGRTLQAGTPAAGPADQRPVQQRQDVLVYTSAALVEDLTVIGTVTAHLVVTSSTEQADVLITLCDVHPDGRVLNVVDGVLRSAGAVGEWRALDIRVGSTAHVFLAGHRLRIAVTAASWPRLELSPTGTLELDRARSSVTLPVAPEGP